MAPAPRCAYCRKRSAVPEYRPFCSRRCKMADLGRWLSWDYRVPAGPAADAALERDADDEAMDSAASPFDPDHEPTR